VLVQGLDPRLMACLENITAITKTMLENSGNSKWKGTEKLV
jgi:hypothetical protein